MKIEVELGVTEFPAVILAIDGLRVEAQPILIKAASKQEAIGICFSAGKKLFPDSRIEVIVNSLQNSMITNVETVELF